MNRLIDGRTKLYLITACIQGCRGTDGQRSRNKGAKTDGWLFNYCVNSSGYRCRNNMRVWSTLAMLQGLGRSMPGWGTGRENLSVLAEMRAKESGTRVRNLCVLVNLLVENEVKEKGQKKALGPIRTKGVWRRLLWRTLLFRDNEELNGEHRICRLLGCVTSVTPLVRKKGYLQLYLTLNFAGHKNGGNVKKCTTKKRVLT